MRTGHRNTVIVTDFRVSRKRRFFLNCWTWHWLWVPVWICSVELLTMAGLQRGFKQPPILWVLIKSVPGPAIQKVPFFGTPCTIVYCTVYTVQYVYKVNKNTLYIDDLRIDDWSSILRSSILSISTIWIDDPNISQSYNIKVPVWITSRLPTPIIRYFCVHYWSGWCFEVTKFVSKSVCLIKCPFEVVRILQTRFFYFLNLFKSICLQIYYLS